MRGPRVIGRRRHPHRVLVGAVACLLLGLAPVALGTGGIAVTINGHDGLRLPLETLQQHIDVPLVPTSVLTAAGTRRSEDHGGTSARELVERIIGIPVEALTTLEIPRTSAEGSVVLSRDDVADGFAGDPLGPRVATFDSEYGPEVHFFRPMRQSDDVNDRDRVDAPIGSDLRIRVTTGGDPLDVTALVDGTTVASGTPVDMNAIVAPPPADRDLRYTWSFGDGRIGDGAAVTHAYPADGTYDVTVTVVAPDGSAGISAPVRIIVGAAPSAAAAQAPSADAGGTPTAPPPATPPKPTGPRRSGSGSGNGGGSATSGTGTATRGPTTGAARPGRAHPRTTTTPRQEGTHPGTHRSGDATRSTPDTGSARQSAPEPRASAPGNPQPATPSPQGTRIHGTVVAGTRSEIAEAVAAAQAVADLPDTPTNAARGGAGHDGPAGPIGGVAVVVGLLAAGALRESRRIPRLLASA